jgi:Uncharacterized membrane-associated protein
MPFKGDIYMEALVEGILGQLTHISPWVIYIYFFISALLQITFPPYPGDTVLIFGGYLGSIGVYGHNILIFASYFVGTAISSCLIYIWGYKKGEALLHIKLISKYFPKPSQVKAEKWLLKYGIYIFLISKFIPGLNSIIILLGGILRYNPTLAMSGICFASLVHNLIFFLVGRSIGFNLGNIKKFLSTYNKIVICFFAVVFIAYISYKLYKKHKCKNTSLR